jgi:hypothetical protein
MSITLSISGNISENLIERSLTNRLIGLCTLRRRFLGIVTSSCPHRQLAVLGCFRFGAPSPVSSHACRLAEPIAYGVLGSNIASDLRCDVIQILQRSRKVCDADCLLRQPLECRSGLLRFAPVGSEKQSNGIDDRRSQILNSAEGLCPLEVRCMIRSAGNNR